MILAFAGVHRRGLTGLYQIRLSVEIMLPASGRRLWREIRRDDAQLKELMRPLTTKIQAFASRRSDLSRALEGGCQSNLRVCFFER